ncbi:MAG: tRNA preQ1(34) S-adenosylmethionine ribosyltransferase-isomerase QueA [Planctomycetota bacterium]|nr:tRNA preQ1(34) S-adenosylmethionine ribosyltransferase-isomerase QueA [Planctomycetota bacterium]
MTGADRSPSTTGSSSLPTAALDYDLPQHLIAMRPAEPRDSARLLVVRRSGDSIEHRVVRDLPEYLAADDLLVFNDTAVAPARLFARREETGGRLEGLFLEEIEKGRWRIMLKPARRLKPGHRLELTTLEGAAGEWALELEANEGGEWIARLDPPRPAEIVLNELGGTPLPPYIIRARRAGAKRFDDADDRRWYQTVYADPGRRGSVAAPTAGLHFTPALLKAIDKRGVQRRHVTLHVGPGTFKPISADTVGEHDMHAEWYEAPRGTIAALRAAKERRAVGPAPTPRVLAVGTSTVRTLESLPDPLPPASDASITGETELLIAPPYPFRYVDGMLTNFHLPRSTLLALVASMIGLDRVLAVYREAVKREYRFYSYGDAMLILP